MYQQTNFYREHCRNEARARIGAHFQRLGPVEALKKPVLKKPEPVDHNYGSAYFRIGAPNPMFAHSWGFSKCMGPNVRTYREGMDWRNLYRCKKDARPPSRAASECGDVQQEQEAPKKVSQLNVTADALPDKIFARGRWWFPSKAEAELHEARRMAQTPLGSSRPGSRGGQSSRAQTTQPRSRYALKNLDNATRTGFFSTNEGENRAADQVEIMEKTFKQQKPKFDMMANPAVTMMCLREFEQEECPAKTGLHDYLAKIRYDADNPRCSTAPNRSTGGMK